MNNLYNILTQLSYALLWVASHFNKKLKLFISGRKETFTILKNKFNPSDSVIWMHCASLGEYEQGLPIINSIKQDYPKYKILLSFFSPSGYENQKGNEVVDAVVYLPADTKKNAKKFIDLINPEIAMFVKYEFWPNYLFELHSRQIPSILLSGLFRPKQYFFTWFGKYILDAIKTMDHLFVQNLESKMILQSHGITNVTVSGDTRFDRVSQQIEIDNSIIAIEDFKAGKLCVVIGSSWPEDISVLKEFINTAPVNVKFIIAPHKIDTPKIKQIQSSLNYNSVLYSEKENHNLSSAKVLIIDTIGLLKHIYYYADIAYIGGAMGKTGLHNILEAATFGIPIVIGKNYAEFPEAIKLESLAGLYSISTSEECIKIMNKLVANDSFRNKTGMIAGHFVNTNTGAAKTTSAYLKTILH